MFERLTFQGRPLPFAESKSISHESSSLQEAGAPSAQRLRRQKVVVLMAIQESKRHSLPRLDSEPAHYLHGPPALETLNASFSSPNFRADLELCVWEADVVYAWCGCPARRTWHAGRKQTDQLCTLVNSDPGARC